MIVLFNPIAYEDQVLGIATGERDRVIARTEVIDVEIVQPGPD